MKLRGLRAWSLVGAAALVGSAIAVIAIAPASADSNPYLFVSYDGAEPLNIPANGGTRALPAVVHATGPYTGATVTFDFTDLAGVATAALPAADNCTTSGATVTCPVPDITDGSTEDFPFPITLTSIGGVATGSVNSFVTYNGGDNPAGPFDIAVFDGPELDLSGVSDGIPANPGDSITMNLDIANLGSESSPNLLVVYDDAHGIVPSDYDNCLYANWTQDAGTFVACTIPGALAVGQQVALHDGFQATIATDSATSARSDAFVFSTSSATPTAPNFGDWAGVTFSARPHSGRTLTADAVPTDGTIQPGTDLGTFWYYVVNTTADIAVTASQSTISGAVGDSVDLTLGFVDNGPGWLESWSSHEPSVDFTFVVPAWATVTSAPTTCDGYAAGRTGPPHPGAPGLALYECSEPNTYFLAPNSPYTLTFGLKLTATSGTAGKVMTGEDGFVPPDDPNAANNITAINAGTIAPPPGDTFVPVAPQRILDTRFGTGAPKAKVGANGSITLQVTGVAGVPSKGVTAVVMNVTAVSASANTFITVYPHGGTLPNASNLNVTKGETLADLVTVPVADGSVVLHNSAGSVDLLADITGYYTSGPNGSSYTPIGPVRMLDTRSGVGAPKDRVASHGKVVLQVDGVQGVPASGVTAVVMNLTAVSPTAAGYVIAYPDGSAQPIVSNLNYAKGQTVPNLVVVPITDGRVDLYNSGGTVDLLADVVGYYSASGSVFHSVGPVRAVDTRNGTGVRSGPVGPAGTITWTVGGTAGLPATGVTAVVLTVTVTSPTASSFLTVYPDGQARPNTSNLNYTAGTTIANQVIVPVVDGKVSFFNQNGSTHVIADVSGYFTH